MKKKLILIAMCGALALSAAGCSVAKDAGDMVSDAGQAVSQVIDDAANAVSDAASAMEGDNSGVSSTTNNTPATIETADEARSALEAGNQAYLNGTANMNISSDLRSNLATNGQKPHTIVITCSDSRVPPELIFNSGLGELFVIRTAGNVVDNFEIGSVEYAADHLGSPLILVLGHSHCGAVGAAVEGHATGNIESIVEEITPSVEKAKENETEEDKITAKAEDLNVENSIEKLRTSEILSNLESEGKVKIIGGKYDIDTGKVTFFDNDTNTDTTTESAVSSEA
ncbi:MAG: carbonic anhydrase [Oscillospiraceae bacterium]|nr:carbonic anhydrase [Oscillospiraceae bacterium]